MFNWMWTIREKREIRNDGRCVWPELLFSQIQRTWGRLGLGRKLAVCMDDLVQRQIEMMRTYIIHKYALTPEKYMGRAFSLLSSSSSFLSSSLPSLPSPLILLLVLPPSPFLSHCSSVLETELSVPCGRQVPYLRVTPRILFSLTLACSFPCPFSGHCVLKMGF